MGIITDVQTFKKGTIVRLLYRRKNKEVYFIDKNNNGKLDTKDKKFVEIGTSNKHSYVFSRITRRDIRKYGSRISGIFKKAKEVRGKLRKTVRPQKKGKCVMAIGKWTSISPTRTFSPPLTLSTRWSKTSYKALSSSGLPQNPSLCTRAVSTFKGIPGNALVGGVVSVGKGDFRFLVNWVIAGRYSGYRNDSGYADVFYKLGGVRYTHIDVVK